MSARERLAAAPYRFAFFQALRRLESEHPDKPRLGMARRRADEFVRLGQRPSLVFAPSEIAEFSVAEDGGVDRLSVFFLGLFGPNGPLPLHLTEYAADRAKHQGDRSFAAFADVFHHRMLSLLYRAWCSSRPAVAHDRPDDDRFQLYVGALSGLASPSLRDRDALPDLAKLHFAGLLAAPTRHADGLRRLLQGFFGVDFDVEPFVGTWLTLPEEARGRLGSATLGGDATIGERVFERQLKFRLVAGAMGLEEYRRFLPGSGSLDRMKAMVRQYVGDTLLWELRLVLRGDDVPPLRLGAREGLGLTTWLPASGEREDAADLTLQLAPAS